jgi:hypothetical protein
MIDAVSSALRGRRLAAPALLGLVVLTVLAGPAAGSSYSIAYGGSVTATTTTSGENATLTFAGSAGDRLSMRLSGVTMSPFATTGDTASIKTGATTVVGPVTFGRNGAWVEPVTLPTTGTYTITLNPSSTYTGKATVQIWKVPADASGSTTEGGPPATLAMTTPGQNGSVTVPGAAGDRVSVKISGVTIGTSTSNSAAVTIRNPDGTTLTPSFNTGTSGAFVEPVTLAQTGTYTIAVDPKTWNAGSATVSVYQVAPDSSASLSVGTQLPLSFTSPGQNGTVTFAGTAGQRMALNVSGVTVGSSLSAGTNVTILNPDATSLTPVTAVGTSGKFFEPVTLPQTGTYTIKVDPQGANTGSLKLDLYNPPADSTGTLTLGGAAVPFSVAASAAGQNGTLTFSGTAGQKIALNLSSVTIGSLVAGTNVTVKTPAGTALAPTFAVGTSGGFMDKTTLPATGTYTIVLNPQGAGTGSMNVQGFIVPADVTATTAAAASPTPATLTNTVPGQNMSVTFTGALNQRILVDLTGDSIGTSTSGAQVSLIRPNNVTLGTAINVGTNGGVLDTMTLPVAGTYTLKVNPTGANTGSISVSVYSVPADSTGTMPLLTSGGAGGSTLSLSVPGQNFSRTFTGTAGRYVSLDMTSVAYGTSAGFGAQVTITSPTGSKLVIGPFNSTTIAVGTNGALMAPVKLPSTGTYVLAVNPVGDAVGSGTFRLFDLGTSPVVAGGALQLNASSLTPTTTMPGQSASVTYAATAGEHDTLSVDAGNACSVSVSVPGIVTNYQMPPGGTMPITFPSTATYTFTVAYAGDCYGPETMALSNP